MSLVLSRRVGEAVIISLPDGREVKVSLLDILGRRASVGVEAPRDVAIRRDELLPPDGDRPRRAA